MSMRSLTSAALALALLPALGACALMGKADAPVTLRLSPAFAEASGSRIAASVSVAPVLASGFVAAQRYAYVDPARPGEISQAKTLFWEQPPSRVLERALVEGLRRRFATVSGPEVSLPAEVRVVATLDHFEELSTAGASKALVGFRASVISAGKVGLAGTWCASREIAGGTPTDRAHAFDQALAAAVSAFAQDMAAGASTSSGAC
jgi:ABC-type uncharacterized transport system auxiliary subunit